MECPNKEQNLAACSCASNDCSRKGTCCECIRAHREKNGIPSCLREIVQAARP